MPFGRLPREVLERIVGYAAAYDSTIQGGRSWSVRSMGQTDGSQLVHTSARHGRSVHSLSLVDRALRSVALPFLFGTVAIPALKSPAFQYRRIPAAVLDCLTSIDMRGANYRGLCTLALWGHRLPHLATVIVDTDLARDIVYMPDVQQWRQPTENVYMPDFDMLCAELGATQGPKTRQLEISWVGVCDQTLTAVLPFLACPATLTHLSLAIAPDFDNGFATRLLELLDTFTAIETLEITDAEFPTSACVLPDEIFTNPRLNTSLRRLVIQSGDPNLLALVEVSYPRLRSLELGLPVYHELSAFDVDTPLITLPDLRHFSLACSASSMPILQLINVSSLRTLEVCLYTADEQVYVDAGPLLYPTIPYPPSLHFRMSVPSTVVLFSPSDINRIFSRRGVFFDLRLHDTLATLGRAGSEGDDLYASSSTHARPYAPAQSQQQDDLMRRTISWAGHRLSLLGRTHDEVGASELAQALLPLEELRLVEEM